MDGTSRVSVMLVAAASALFALLASGCMPEVEQDDSPSAGDARARPLLDSAAETLPLPNDAALDDQGTLPELDGYEEESARGVFLTWLGQLHGWLTATPIEIPFDARLTKETVEPSALRLYALEDGTVTERLEIERVSYEKASVNVSDDSGEIGSVDGSIVTVHPASELQPRSEYAVVVTEQIEGANGRPITEPQPIFFAASEEPLVDENGEKTIASLPDDATAQQLEALRQSLQPIFERASNNGIPRGEVAMAFRWTTVQDPVTILDPATETLPLPNTAALDRGPEHPEDQQETFPVGGVDGVEVGTDDEGNPVHERTEDTAQAYFNAYLDRLHGWPPQTPIVLPIDGPIDPETVGPESVQVWMMPKTEDGKPAQVEVDSVNYNAEESRIEVVPHSSLRKQRRFVAFATQDVERSVPGTDRRYSLKLPAALQMAIQPHPILENGSSTVGRISDEQAEAIAQLQPFMRKAATFVDEQTETSVGDLGAIWTWETWNDTFVVFDPEAGVLPFPNDFVRRGENGTVSLPTDGLSGLQQTIVEELNRRQGFSTTAPGWIPVDGPVKPETITKENIPFLWRDGTPTLYDGSRYTLDYKPDWGQIVVRADQPWNRDYRTDPTNSAAVNIAAVTTDLVGGDGNPVKPSPAFVFLRSPFPLYENGSSTIDQLGDDAAQQLESARQQFSTLFQFAESGLIDGLDIDSRDELATAYAWHPQNTPQRLQELRAQAIAKVEARSSSSVTRACAPNCSNDPNAVQDPGAQYKGPDGMGTAVDMSNVARIQWAAEFDTVEFRDANGRLTDFQSATAETVGISVFVPKTSGNSDCPSSGPPKVAILQHGLGSYRVRIGMAMANAMAARCIATVAMDFPGHGGRAPGAMSLHPATHPASSGNNFLSTDLIRTKGNLFQSAVDVAVLAQIIRNDGLESAIDDDASTDFFAGDAAGYVGQSLGGFIGFPETTVDSNITTAVFNVTGGGYSDVLSNGQLGGDILSALEGAGLDEGSFARFRALSFVQWIADPMDPIGFAPWIAENSLSETTYTPGSGFSTGGSLPNNEVLLQMAENPQTMGDDKDDKIVPNATTERLANAAGLSLSESTFSAKHGFLTVLDSSRSNFAQTECARRQAADWIWQGLNGDVAYDDVLKASTCLSGN